MITFQHNNFFLQKPLVAVLTNLKKYTRYRVVIQAYNRIGAGPRNQDLIVSTAEDGNVILYFITHKMLLQKKRIVQNDMQFLVFRNNYFFLLFSI